MLVSQECVTVTCFFQQVFSLFPSLSLTLLQDMDIASFAQNSLWDRFFRTVPHIGLMAQGLQRSLDAGGWVKALEKPSQTLKVGCCF